LAGKNQEFLFAEELEAKLDHFVHARWMRTRRGEENPLKAKENIDYVKVLQSVISSVENLYHELCSICHPSESSIDYFYDIGPEIEGSFKLSPYKDVVAISDICRRYPDALQDALMMHCNVPLVILRVLHKFKVHPQLKALKKLDIKQIKMGPEIERFLNS
jgi:hypothetical protein